MPQQSIKHHKTNRQSFSAAIQTQSAWQHLWFKPHFDYALSQKSSQHGFHNAWIEPKTQPASLLKWAASFNQRTAWQPYVATQPTATASVLHNLSKTQTRICFVNHATLLIQIAGYNFLTDPVWSMRASPFNFAGPKRVTDVGLALTDLPKIDAILLSHNHYDHMDLASLQWLHQHFAMPIITGLANAAYLPKDFQVIELDWWQHHQLNDDIAIIYTPAQHFSGRGLTDHNHALWGGLSVKTQHQHVFFAGDTGYAPHFKHIRQRLGNPDIALLPIGAYQPQQWLKHVHMNPREAVQAHLDLQACYSIPMHYGTFQLTFEGYDQPLMDLAAAKKNLTVADEHFFALPIGHHWQLPT